MSDEKNRSAPSREGHDGADNLTPSTENYGGLHEVLKTPKSPEQSGGGSSSGGNSGGSSGGGKKD